MSEKSTTPLTDAAAKPLKSWSKPAGQHVPVDFARSLETVMHQLERCAAHHDGCPADGRGLRSGICGCGLKQTLAAYDRLTQYKNGKTINF